MRCVVERVSESEGPGIKYNDESVQDDSILRVAGFDVLYIVHQFNDASEMSKDGAYNNDEACVGQK